MPSVLRRPVDLRYRHQKRGADNFEIAKESLEAIITLTEINFDATGLADLKYYVQQYFDAQRNRIRMTNRLKSRGANAEDEAIELARSLEKAYATAVKRQYASSIPEEIHTWQEVSEGIGALLVAELLGRIGDPRLAEPKFYMVTDEKAVLAYGEPFQRTVRQLYAYCGHGDPTRRRRRGMTAEEVKLAGDPVAKRTVHLMAEACVKVGKGRYNKFYYNRKEYYKDKHPEWNPGHHHNAALRVVGKAILRDLWRVAHGQEAEYGW